MATPSSCCSPPCGGFVLVGPLVHESNTQQVIGFIDEAIIGFRWLAEQVGWVELPREVMGLKNFGFDGLQEAALCYGGVS